MRPRHLNVLLFPIVLGVAVGIGVYTFIYAKGFSYLTNDPSACANCHIMDDHFSAWLKSSHQPVALDSAKIGLLVASLISGIGGWLLLTSTGGRGAGTVSAGESASLDASPPRMEVTDEE